MTIAILAILLTLRAQQPQALEVARETAIHYAAQLPDFLCIEKIVRSDSLGLASNSKVDRLTIELSYYNQKEKQKLLDLDGQPASQPLASLDGLITGGEFGTLLLGVFDPSSASQFQYKGSTTVHNRHASIYTYRIDRSHSRYLLGHRIATGQMVGAAAGYSGQVVLDDETHRVLRLVASATDIPKETGILQSSVEIEYDFIEVGGKSYLLPAHSKSHMERPYRQISNSVTFSAYRKFESDANISFKDY